MVWQQAICLMAEKLGFTSQKEWDFSFPQHLDWLWDPLETLPWDKLLEREGDHLYSSSPEVKNA